MFNKRHSSYSSFPSGPGASSCGDAQRLHRNDFYDDSKGCNESCVWMTQLDSETRPCQLRNDVTLFTHYNWMVSATHLCVRTAMQTYCRGRICLRTLQNKIPRDYPSRRFPEKISQFIYPLVILHSYGKIHHAINGKIHYFYGHFQ